MPDPTTRLVRVDADPDEWDRKARGVLALGGEITTNEHGTPVSVHVCRACGQRFTFCPPSPRAVTERLCLGPDCESYDPARDAEVFFAPDDLALIEGNPDA